MLMIHCGRGGVSDEADPASHSITVYTPTADGTGLKILAEMPSGYSGWVSGVWATGVWDAFEHLLETPATGDVNNHTAHWIFREVPWETGLGLELYERQVEPVLYVADGKLVARMARGYDTGEPFPVPWKYERHDVVFNISNGSLVPVALK